MESRALGVRGWGCVGSLASRGKPVFGSLCCRISWLCVPLPTWAACLSWWNQVVHRIGVARFNVCVNVPSPLLFVLIAQLMEWRSLPESLFNQCSWRSALKIQQFHLKAHLSYNTCSCKYMHLLVSVWSEAC